MDHKIITVDFLTYPQNNNPIEFPTNDIDQTALIAMGTGLSSSKRYRYNTVEDFKPGDTAVVNVNQMGGGLKLVRVIEVEAVAAPSHGLKWAVGRFEAPNLLDAKLAAEKREKARKRLESLRESYSDIALLETLRKAGLVDDAEFDELQSVLK